MLELQLFEVDLYYVEELHAWGKVLSILPNTIKLKYSIIRQHIHLANLAKQVAIVTRVDSCPTRGCLFLTQAHHVCSILQVYTLITSALCCRYTRETLITPYGPPLFHRGTEVGIFFPLKVSYKNYTNITNCIALKSLQQYF